MKDNLSLNQMLKELDVLMKKKKRKSKSFCEVE